MIPNHQRTFFLIAIAFNQLILITVPKETFSALAWYVVSKGLLLLAKFLLDRFHEAYSTNPTNN